MTEENDKIFTDLINKLQKENEKLKEINNINNDEEFIYSYEELQDKVINLQQENERLKEDNLLIKSANKLVSDNLHNYKSRCENTDKIMYEFEEWLKSNFWNDDEGNESYQIEKYTTYYSVYNKLKELKESEK